MTSSSRVRFGIIGCGAIGPTHAAAIGQLPDAEVVAVADLNAERAASVGKKFSVTRVYRDERELIADPDVDVVCVCTPSGMHADMTVAALTAGKHVIVEKPMDISLEACDRMIDAQRKSGRKLSVICQHRFDAASRLVRDKIAAGDLGRIVLATASVKWWRTQHYYDSGDWRGTWKWDGGGALMNQGVHTVDLLQWLAGGVESLWAQTRTAAHERIEVEDTAVAALVFKNGAVGSLCATTAAYDGFPVRVDLFGTEGSAIIEGDRLRALTLKNGTRLEGRAAASHALSVARGGTASVKDEAAAREADAEEGEVWGDSHRAQIADVLRAIRTDSPVLIDGVEGRKPLEIILGVYQSQRSGQVVHLNGR